MRHRSPDRVALDGDALAGGEVETAFMGLRVMALEAVLFEEFGGARLREQGGGQPKNHHHTVRGISRFV